MSAVGYGALRYEWNKIGNDTTPVECIETETDSLTISSFSHKHQGSYTCTVYDDHKSIKSEPFHLILGMVLSLILFLLTDIMPYKQHSTSPDIHRAVHVLKMNLWNCLCRLLELNLCSINGRRMEQISQIQNVLELQHKFSQFTHFLGIIKGTIPALSAIVCSLLSQKLHIWH